MFTSLAYFTCSQATIQGAHMVTQLFKRTSVNVLTITIADKEELELLKKSSFS